jgi:tetratricopeptide (TPR) repeat protein
MLWRDGDWDAAEEQFRHSRELASQVGWSEVTFQALFGLATTLRERGDYNGAVDALKQALDVCERAGLIAQSIQAISQRAIVLTLAGNVEAAREAAGEAADLAERLHYPVGKAAATEAAGFTAVSQEDGADLLRMARAHWEQIGRPLEAARCDLLAGRVLLEYDPEAAHAALDAAARAYDELGMQPLAQRARELAAA